MPINYKLIPRKNPIQKDEAKMYYASAVTTGKDTTNELALEIANNTTLGRPDIIGVLTALEEIIINRLRMGRKIDLLNICILSPKVTSKGVDSPDAFNVNQHIKQIGINIRPKQSLVNAIQNAGLEKA